MIMVHHSWAHLWTLNPFVAGISTRGNAESILSLLVLTTFYLLETKRVFTSAIVFGLSVHFKVYPIMYAIPIWFGIDSIINPHHRFRFYFFSWTRFQFGLVAASIFFGLNVLMYHFYGQEFLQETYLYHISRKDHRHNFSFYFYHMYLSTDHSIVASVLSFIPQLSLVAILGMMFSDDVVFACFLQTFAFVALNKVCTSQVFIY
jgi:phosphatidylinositol glycan class M